MVMGSSEKTLLNVLRSCRMEVPSNGALDMNVSPHLTIGYLLRSKRKDLEFKSHGWFVKIRGSGLILDVLECVGLMLVMLASAR